MPVRLKVHGEEYFSVVILDAVSEFSHFIQIYGEHKHDQADAVSNLELAKLYSTI